MLKTNNKQVKESIRNYIINSLDYGYKTTGENLAAAVENWENYTRRKTTSGTIVYENISLADFLTNYSCDFDYYYQDQRNLLKEWLQETEEEAEKYSDEEVSRLYLRLLNRHTHALIHELCNSETIETLRKVLSASY